MGLLEFVNYFIGLNESPIQCNGINSAFVISQRFRTQGNLRSGLRYERLPGHQVRGQRSLGIAAKRAVRHEDSRDGNELCYFFFHATR